MSRQRKFLLLFLLGLPLLCTLLAAGLWHARQPFLNAWVRPRLEAFLAERLAARVRIGALTLEPGELRIDRVRIEQPGRLQLQIAETSCEFTLAGLWHRELAGVRVVAPEVVWTLPSAGEAPAGGLGGLEPTAFRLGEVTIREGRLQLHQGERTITLGKVAGMFRAGSPAQFNLQAALLGERPIAIKAVGTGTWESVPALTLAELVWNDRSLLVTPVTVSLPAGGLRGGGEIAIDHLNRALVFNLLGALGEAEALPPDVDFTLNGVRLLFSFGNKQLSGQMKVAEAHVMKDNLRLPFTDLSLSAQGFGDQWRIEGSGILAGNAQATFKMGIDKDGLKGNGEGRVFELGRLPAQLTRGEGWPLAGGLDWQGSFSEHDGHRSARVTFSGRPDRVPGTDFLLDISPLQGALQVDSNGERKAGRLSLRLGKRSLLTAAGSDQGFSWALETVPLVELAPLLGPGRWPPSLGRNGVFKGHGELHRGTGVDNWQGAVALAGDGWQVGEVSVSRPKFGGQLQLSGGIVGIAELEMNAGLAGYGVSLPQVSLRGTGRWKEGEGVLEFARLEVSGGEYLSDDGFSGLSGGSAELRGRMVWQQASAMASVAATGRLRATEVLAGSFYGEVSALPVTLDGSATWRGKESSLQVEGISLDLPGVGTWRGRGDWSPTGLHMAGDLVLSDLKETIAGPVGPILTGSFPALADLRLAGALHAALNGDQNQAGWQLSGELSATEVNLMLPNFQLTDLNGHFPVALASGRIPEGRPRTGTLTFDQLQAGPLRAGPTRLTLTTAPNRVNFGTPWVFSLAAGRVELTGVQFGWDSEGLLVSGRTRLQRVDLESLTQELQLTPLAGTLDADIGEFQYQGGTLLSEGEAHFDVFGGSIVLRNLQAHDLFSNYRSFQTDIDLKGIDLYQLTRTFEFGEMNGILDGSIRDLSLFGTVPSAFVAELATRPSGRRNISVKALNNLTVISQGSVSAILSHGLYRFFDFYRYRRIGIYCSLKNDVFTLRGTAKPGSDRYLVESGWLPPKIDILAPTSTISFKEMLKRVGRIDRKAAR